MNPSENNCRGPYTPKAGPAFMWKYLGSSCLSLVLWEKVTVGKIDLGIISVYVLNV